MFASCCKMLLLKNSIRVGVFLDKGLRVTPRLFQPKLYISTSELNNGYHSFRNTKNKKYEENEPKKNIKYQKTYLETVIREIKQGNNFLNPTSISQVSSDLWKELASKRTPDNFEAIKKFVNSKEFIKFSSTIQNYIPELDPDTIINLIKICFHFGVENKNVHQLVTKFFDRSELLPFKFRGSWYLRCRRSCKTDIENNILIRMEPLLLKELENKAYLTSKECATLSLEISVHDFVPVDMKVEILQHFLTYEEWNEEYMLKYFIHALNHFPKDHPSHSHFKNSLFEKLSKESLTNASFVTSFLKYYAFDVKNKISEYNEKLIDDLVNSVLKLKLKSNHVESLGNVLLELRHVNYNFSNFVCELIEDNIETMPQHPDFFVKCLEVLGDSNHDEENEFRWQTIKPCLHHKSAITSLMLLNQKLLPEFFDVVLSFAALEVYRDEALKILSERLNEEEGFMAIKRVKGLGHQIGILNQSVLILHRKFKKPLVSDFLLSHIIKDVQSSFTKRKHKSLRKIKENLISVSQIEDPMIFNCLTKGGMSVDGVLAINDKGEPYSFKSLKSEQQHNAVYIEDISLPSNFKLITISCFVTDQYSRNTGALQRLQSLQIKTLQAMGFLSFYYFEDSRKNLSDETKEEKISLSV